MSLNKQDIAQTSNEMRAAYEVQQDFGKASVLHSEIVWDVLGPDQSDFLTRKLECMFPNDHKIYTSKQDTRRKNKNNANLKKVKQNLFSNLWIQRKYCNGALLHSIIYVLVTPDLNMEKAKYAHNYTIHPVFRTRRCLKTNSSEGCCMIFIDEKSRIYQNWNDFVENNELPYGIMIAPKRGCYSLDIENKVDLEFYFTPAYTHQDIAAADNVISVVSLVGQTAALLNPALAIISIGAKTYETVRNYQKMSDNVAKGTTTNCKANISLAGDILSLTSAVATLGAYMTVPAGEKLSLPAELTLQTLNGTAALINCTKLVFTAYDLFIRYFVDGQELEIADLLAFGSSLMLFTNSINNVIITSQIGKVDGNTLRNMLQSKIRNGLSLISGEVIKYCGQNARHFDLLRLINDIPYKDVLCNIHTVYKNLTRSGFLTTLSVLGAVAIEIMPGLLVKVVDKEIIELDLKELSKHYGSKFVKHIASCENLIDVLNGIGLYFSDSIVQFLFNQTHTFIETKVNEIDPQQTVFITIEMILYKMFSNIIKNYKIYTYEFLDKKSDDILLSILNFFKSLNPNMTDKDSEKYTCDVCGGYYYVVKI